MYSEKLTAASLVAVALVGGMGFFGFQSIAKKKEKAVVPAKLEITDSVVGEGKEAKQWSRIKVLYTGTLYPSGRVFDSSKKHGNEPLEFVLGSGQVIEGWDKGLVGMKAGGTRTLIIPSKMAYGEDGSPPTIPPNATLKFVVEMLEVKN